MVLRRCPYVPHTTREERGDVAGLADRLGKVVAETSKPDLTSVAYLEWPQFVKTSFELSVCLYKYTAAFRYGSLCLLDRLLDVLDHLLDALPTLVNVREDSTGYT